MVRASSFTLYKPSLLSYVQQHHLLYSPLLYFTQLVLSRVVIFLLPPSNMPTPTQQSGNSNPSYPPPAMDSDSDYIDPNEEYIKLKLQITDLTGNRRKAGEKADNAKLKRLQTRLEAVKKDYVFREKEAEAAFQVKRREADQAVLLARLRGEPSVVLTKTKKVPVPEEKAKEPVSKPSNDLLDNSGSDDDSPGGFFELLEPMPTEETQILESP